MRSTSKNRYYYFAVVWNNFPSPFYNIQKPAEIGDLHEILCHSHIHYGLLQHPVRERTVPSLCSRCDTQNTWKQFHIFLTKQNFTIIHFQNQQLVNNHLLSNTSKSKAKFSLKKLFQEKNLCWCSLLHHKQGRFLENAFLKNRSLTYCGLFMLCTSFWFFVPQRSIKIHLFT